MSSALLAFFFVVIGYLAGRADHRDLGALPRPRRMRGYVPSADLVPLLRRSERRRRRLQMIRAQDVPARGPGAAPLSRQSGMAPVAADPDRHPFPDPGSAA